MPRKPNRPLLYGSTVIRSPNTSTAPSASVPRHAARQRPQAPASSELEIDEFIDVAVPEFDQQRQQNEAEPGGQDRSWPRGQPRHDVLTGREQERNQGGDHDWHQVPRPIQMRQ